MAKFIVIFRKAIIEQYEVEYEASSQEQVEEMADAAIDNGDLDDAEWNIIQDSLEVYTNEVKS